MNGEKLTQAAPATGRTVFAHVAILLTRATENLARVEREILIGSKFTRAKREDLWRQLAGVVSDVESIRVWLNMGAPK